MMNVLNIGSLNIDYIYRVPHFVRPGETLSSTNFSCVAGGKGNNQSIALARAGAQVSHCGRIGNEGLFLRELLQQEQVDVNQVVVAPTANGHAIIQVNDQGENAILLYAGANHCFTESDIDSIFADCTANTLVLTQNETNLVPLIIDHASQKNLKIFFNPAPFTKDVLNYPLTKVFCLIVNFTEGQQITGKSSAEEIFAALRINYPNTNLLLTLGEEGVWCYWEGQQFRQKSIRTHVIDTTAAGDTFIGYFIAAFYYHQLSVQDSLLRACQAASLCVSRPGAAPSIPYWNEL